MPKKWIHIGHTIDGSKVELDLQRLLVSRLMVTGSSGSGKSYLLRKILEGVSEHVQTIVIDPEGEFASLREIRDMVLVGPNGELRADPKIAGKLCEQLMTLRLSAVIDTSDMPPADTRSFVTSFCRTMVDLPKKLWHPCIVAMDEIHELAPEDGKSDECTEAVAQLGSRGRKRGYALLGATQRLSKLNKDVAAELKNKLYGEMTLDTDVKRAASDLGLPRARWGEITNLSSPDEEGNYFFAHGSAFNVRGVFKMRADKVKSTHLEAGKRVAFKPPGPSARIKGVLGELKDLAVRAEKELNDKQADRRRIKELETELRQTHHSVSKPQTVLSAAPAAWRQALERAAKMIEKLTAQELEFAGVDKKQVTEIVENTVSRIVKSASACAGKQAASYSKMREEGVRLVGELNKLLNSPKQSKMVTQTPAKAAINTKVTHTAKPAPVQEENGNGTDSGNGEVTSKGDKRVLTAIAQHDVPLERATLRILTRYKTSTLNAYLKNLVAAGLVARSDDKFTATAAGLEALGDDFETLPIGAALREHWLNDPKLEKGPKDILKLLIDRGLEAGASKRFMSREEISEQSNFATSTRNAYIKNLKSRRLICIDEHTDGVGAALMLYDDGEISA